MSAARTADGEARPGEFSGSKVQVAAAVAFGWEAPTGIQAAAHEALAGGHDLVVVAGPARGRTGTWLLPLAAAATPGEGLSALVLVPDAERARALAAAVATAGEGVVALSVDAESDLAKTVWRLERGVDVVVGTVARVRELHSRGALDVGAAGFMVIDRADAPLDTDALSDMEWALAHGKAGRRTVLVMGEIGAPHRRLIKKYLTNSVEVSGLDLPAPPAGVGVAWARGRALREAVVAWVAAPGAGPTLVWTRSQTGATGLAAWLRGAGFRAEALHAGMAARARTGLAARFRRGEVEVLVATDAGARAADLGTPARAVSVGLPAEPCDFAGRALGEVGLEFILEDSERAGFEALTAAWGLEPRSLGLPAMARPVAPGEAVAARAGAAAQAKATAPARKAPGESTVRLYIGGGAQMGATARDVLRELTRRGGIDERAIGFVEVLGRSSFVEVSTQAARQVLDRTRFLVLSGEEVPLSVARPRRPTGEGGAGRPPGREGGGRPPRRDFAERPPRAGGEGPPRRGPSARPGRDNAPQGGEPEDARHGRDGAARSNAAPRDGSAPPRRGWSDSAPRGAGGKGPGRGSSDR